MPIEIRELVIRATVQGAAPLEQAPEQSASDTELDQDALIEECVRQVLEILRREREP